MKKSLNQIMELYGSDKGAAHHGHNYCVNYEKWFEPIRTDVKILLELGIGGENTQLGGASLLGWADYFSNAIILGVDIYDKSALDNLRIKTFKGSQDNKDFLTKLIGDIPPDIIIDDASHINKLTIESFKILFPLLKANGIYVIEDLTCSYRWDFGGDINLKDINLQTTMNYLFEMLHDINPVEIGDSNYKHREEFKDVESIHFYPDMVVIKKK